MRTVIGGNGTDNTVAVLEWLAGGNQLNLATLCLIGEPEDPNAYWLTDWETPLTWSWWGQFLPTSMKRDTVASKVGLEVQTLNLDWSPNNFNFTQDINATSPYQQAVYGKFDGQKIRLWTVYMPRAGDADTFGASELFGGRVGECKVERGHIKFTINSFLDVINQMVPGSVIESSNTIAGFKGACGPGGTQPAPAFTVNGGTAKQIIGTGSAFALDDFVDGFLYFTSGPLQGMWSAIIGNAATVAGNTTFTVAQPFPWPPVAGDTFVASAVFPNSQSGAQYFGFPFVPAPEQAI